MLNVAIIAFPRPLRLIKEARDRQRRRQTWIAFAALALAVTGLTVHAKLAPGSIADATPSVPNACSLLTDADVAKAFGAAVAYRTSKPEDNACSWSGWPYAHQFGQQAVTVDVAPVTRAQFDRAFSSWIVVPDGPASRRTAQAIPIRGVGEAAYAQVFAGASLEVYYRGLVISVRNSMLRSPLDAEKRLAAAAIARLERGTAGSTLAQSGSTRNRGRAVQVAGVVTIWAWSNAA